MSKTLGNVITIEEMLEKFGVDGTRYLILSAGTFGDDVDITMERLTEKYNADLANGLGNLVSRVIKLYQSAKGEINIENIESISNVSDNYERKPTVEFYKIYMEDIRLSSALNQIWEVIIRDDNEYIEQNKPWELSKSDFDKFNKVMQKLISDLYLVSQLLKPFMPETSEKIKIALKEKKIEPLFQRI